VDEDSDESAGDSSAEEQARVPSADGQEKQQRSAKKSKSSAADKKTKQTQPKRISKSAQPLLRNDGADNNAVKVRLPQSADRARPAARARMQQHVLRGLGIQGRAFGQPGNRFDPPSRDQSSLQPKHQTSSKSIEVIVDESNDDIGSEVAISVPLGLSGIAQLAISDQIHIENSATSIDPESPVGAQNLSQTLHSSSDANDSVQSDCSKKGFIVTQLDYVPSLKWITPDESQSSSVKSSQGNSDEVTSVAATEFLEDVTIDDSEETQPVPSGGDDESVEYGGP
jgi:hypothetical protein